MYLLLKCYLLLNNERKVIVMSSFCRCFCANTCVILGGVELFGVLRGLVSGWVAEHVRNLKCEHALCMCVCCMQLECVSVSFSAPSLNISLVSDYCCCQHTLQLLSDRRGRHGVDSFLAFVDFNHTPSRRLPVCVSTPSSSPPSSALLEMKQQRSRDLSAINSHNALVMMR